MAGEIVEKHDLLLWPREDAMSGCDYHARDGHGTSPSVVSSVTEEMTSLR